MLWRYTPLGDTLLPNCGGNIVATGVPKLRAIFVSYRRDDSEGEAGRLYDDLVEMFGDHTVFMDVAAITAGRDFRKAIDENVAQCGVLLAIIGKGWVDVKNESGGRRLNDSGDFVRVEIASALKRDIPVIPLLVHGAKMPRTDELPDDLKDLAYRNCVELTHVRWKSDFRILAKALHTILKSADDQTADRGTGLGRGLESTVGRLEIPSTGQATATSPSSHVSGAVEEPIAVGSCSGTVESKAISRITKELARYIGPIAEVVVKRAAKRCQTVPELRLIVSGEIDAAEDRAKFLEACPSS